MTDTPMTQDKHDTLIDRLEALREYLSGEPAPLLTWQMQNNHNHIPSIQEAISRLKQSQCIIDGDGFCSLHKAQPCQYSPASMTIHRLTEPKE